jgi:hypothetical protein
MPSLRACELQVQVDDTPRCHIPALARHMKDRYKWSQKTFDSINWDVHGLAMRSDMTSKVHLSKLAHEILPTNKQVSRYDKTRKPNCLSCNDQVEDRDHIIRCTHPSRQKWRAQLIKQLRDKCDSMATRPQLQDLLISGIHTWMNGRTISAKNYPRLYSKLIHDQNQIGWRQVFNGRLATEWEALQSDYYKEIKNSNKHRSGKIWTRTIIQTIWTQWRELWNMRNEAIHGHDLATKTRAKRAKAEAQLHQIYSRRQQMLPSHTELLFSTVEEHLQLSTLTIQNWLHIHEPLFESGIRQAKTSTLSGTRPLRRYFQTKQSRKHHHG